MKHCLHRITRSCKDNIQGAAEADSLSLISGKSEKYIQGKKYLQVQSITRQQRATSTEAFFSTHGKYYEDELRDAVGNNPALGGYCASNFMRL